MNKLKRIIILIALPLSGGVGGGLFAQSVQSGIVLEYQGEKAKKALGGVAISAANAGSTMSDGEGRFTLNFRTLKAGDAIQFRRIEKAGFEIMNREAVEVARVWREDPATKPQGTGRSLAIILCRTALLNEIRDGYRSVTVKRYEKQLKEQEAEIERMKKEGRLKEEEYNERLDALEAEYEARLADIETYIDRFARIDMTALSEAEGRTIRLVQEGRFEEAIANYESQDLVGLLNKARAERQQLVEIVEKIDMSIMSKDEENRRLRQSISRQTDLLHLAGGQENMEKIHQILREVFEADTTDVEARRDYANSLVGRGGTDAACNLLKEGIDSSDDNFSKAMMALDIAACLRNNDSGRSQAFVEMADSISQHIYPNHPKLASRVIPSICQIQLYLSYNSDDMAACSKIAARMEKAWQPDSLDLISVGDYTVLASLLADYYSIVGNHQKSIWATKEGVRLDEISYRTAPWRSYLYNSCASACEVLAMEGDWAEAASYARRSLEVAAEVNKALPTQEMMKGLCDKLFTVYWTLIDIGETQLADSVAQFIEPIYEKLHERQREPLKGSRGLFLLAKGNIEAATPLLCEDMGEEAAEITIAPFRAKRLLKEGKSAEATAMMKDAIEAAKAQYREEPDAWNKDTYCSHCITLAEIYAQTGDRKNARKWIKQAEKLVAFESNKLKIKSLTPLTPSPKGEGE